MLKTTPEESWDKLQQIPMTLDRTKWVWIVDGWMLKTSKNIKHTFKKSHGGADDKIFFKHSNGETPFNWYQTEIPSFYS